MSASAPAIEFREWPKIHRLRRDVVITEKVDGTNACIVVTEDGIVAAQSRTRLITPESDNFGFARFVYERAEELAETLGPGYHYGEWYGLGIQRGYGLDHKRFALFNASRWRDTPLPQPLETVPVLYQGKFDEGAIDRAVDDLRENGSRISLGFKPAEGVVVYLAAARTSFKVMLEKDDVPKGLAA